MKKFLLYVIILNLSGCFLTKHHKAGIPIRPKQYEDVQASTTKRDVVKLLGSPSATNFVGEEKWFYYSSESEAFAFFKPEFSKYNILSITFDKDDNIKNIVIKDLKDKNFAFNDDKHTVLPSDIKLNFLQELFGNIGKFNSPGMQQ